MKSMGVAVNWAVDWQLTPTNNHQNSEGTLPSIGATVNAECSWSFGDFKRRF